MEQVVESQLARGNQSTQRFPTPVLVPYKYKKYPSIVQRLCKGVLSLDLDFFQTANEGLPHGSISTTIQHTNVQVPYTIDISDTHKYTYRTK
jgi:hypothetical protein